MSCSENLKIILEYVLIDNDWDHVSEMIWKHHLRETAAQETEDVMRRRYLHMFESADFGSLCFILCPCIFAYVYGVTTSTCFHVGRMLVMHWLGYGIWSSDLWFELYFEEIQGDLSDDLVCSKFKNEFFLKREVCNIPPFSIEFL